MTAIFGILQHHSEPAPSGLMEVAAKTLGHHAIDGLEIWQADRVALGQALTRFWKNSAHTPHLENDKERGLTLVCDARLDNRADLADHLHISNSDLPKIPDSRLILHAYRKWGSDCPRYLFGDFVFAVWDAHEQTLFAVRDPIGIRWLYFSTSPNRFSFASDIAGVLDLMDEAPHIDMESLDEFFSSSTNRQVNHTFYKNVHKLLPGQALRVQDGKLKIWAYWKAEDVPATTLRDPREGAEYLGQLLKQAVACRAETVDLLGAHLSGGLDSSALTALAVSINRQQGRPDPLAFSWSPPLELRPLLELDERVYVQRIAEHLGIPVEYTHVPPEIDVLHETSDPSILPLNTIRFEYQLMINARQKGSRVLLSGWGGDELAFSRGIGYPSGLIKQGRWLALARYLKYQYGWRPHRWINGLYAHAIYPLLPSTWQVRLPGNLKWERNSRQRRIQQARQELLFSLPSPGFFQTGFYTRLEAHHKQKFQWIQPGLHNSQRWYLTSLLSRVESWALWSARLGMRHAYPLLDQRIVEFVLSIPEDWIYWQGRIRRFGQHAIADVLPINLLAGRDKQDRALFAHQKTIEHKWEVNKNRLAVFEAHRQTNPPATQWLDFDYLQRVLLEPPATLNSPRPAKEFLPRIGIWQALNFAFIDPRATLEENS